MTFFYSGDKKQQSAEQVEKIKKEYEKRIGTMQVSSLFRAESSG